MKKRIVRLFSVMMLGVMMLSGCENKSAYGDAIFTCSPKNMFGFEGVYIKDDILTINFETKYDKYDDEYMHTGLDNIFEDGDLGHAAINIFDEDMACCHPKNDDVTVDSKKETLSFELDRIDAEDIYSVYISNDRVFFYYNIDENKLLATVYDEERLHYVAYEQIYDEKAKKWSDPEIVAQL